MTEPAINPRSPAWAREPVQRLLSNVRQIREFYHLTIDGLRMIIHHHEFLVRADERIKQLVSEYRRELRPRHRSSIEVFESILHEFGLQGAMNPELKRSLIELEFVRNLLLHKRGIADSRFLEGCPWITVKIGAAIIPDEQSVKQHTDAVLDYAELLLGRINLYFTSKPSKSGTGNAT